MSHRKPSAIFQFGQNTTRYEIAPSVCQHCKKRFFEENSGAKNKMCDNAASALRVTGTLTSNFDIEVHHV